MYGHCCKISFIILEHDDNEILSGLDSFRLTGASLHPSDLILKFPGTTVPLLTNPSSLDDDYEDEVHILSSTVVDEDDISTDIDWFEENHGVLSPCMQLSPDEQSIFNSLRSQIISSFDTEYDSLGCCTVSKHEIGLEKRTPIFSHPY